MRQWHSCGYSTKPKNSESGVCKHIPYTGFELLWSDPRKNYRRPPFDVGCVLARTFQTAKDPSLGPGLFNLNRCNQSLVQLCLHI